MKLRKGKNVLKKEKEHNETWGNIKLFNVCVIVVQKDKEEWKIFEEIMAENFPNLKKALIYTRK